jgi:hypothetical protein
MGVHLIGLQPPAEINVEDVGPFTGYMRVWARPGLRGGEPVLVCHNGGRERTVDDCRMCSRFVDVCDGAGRERIVTCAWSHRDPVSARMTDCAALVCVAPETRRRDADELAIREGLHHLLVVSSAALVGVCCRCDLSMEGGRRVSTCMSTEIFAIHPTASLGAAVSALRWLRIGFLPVVADGFLVGVITRGDLRRAGIPEELLAPRPCDAHCVRPSLASAQ